LDFGFRIVKFEFLCLTCRHILGQDSSFYLFSFCLLSCFRFLVPGYWVLVSFIFFLLSIIFLSLSLSLSLYLLALTLHFGLSKQKGLAYFWHNKPGWNILFSRFLCYPFFKLSFVEDFLAVIFFIFPSAIMD